MNKLKPYCNLVVQSQGHFRRVRFNGMIAFNAISLSDDGAIQILDSNAPQLERGLIVPSGISGAIKIIEQAYKNRN